MKWIQHYTDSHTNGKMRMILRKHGLEGFGFCWICRELVAKEGFDYRIKAEKHWKSTLSEVVCKSISEVDVFLEYQAEIGAIDAKAFKNGDLYIPKLREYSDDYTKKLRRDFVETSVRIDKIRIDKIILHYVDCQDLETVVKNNQILLADIFKRNVRPAKQLILIANNDDMACRAISRMAEEYKLKNLNWTLETVIRHYGELIKPIKSNSEGAAGRML